MGVDIHCELYRNGKWNEIDLDGYRNSEWFRSLGGYSVIDPAYNHLPYLPFTEVDKAREKELTPDGCYGFIMFNFRELVEWFRKYRPDFQAGWVSVYDKWMLDNKNEIPKDVYMDIPEHSHRDNWVFAEWYDEYDPMLWFLEKLKENDVDGNENILIYFDR